jgi:hypothetical protein
MRKGIAAMLSFQSAAHGTTSASEPGLFGRLVRRLYQLVCGLHGHDALLHFGTDRVSLRCTSCGHETPGWNVKAGPLRAAQATSVPRRVVQMPLVQERRVA